MTRRRAGAMSVALCLLWIAACSDTSGAEPAEDPATAGAASPPAEVSFTSGGLALAGDLYLPETSAPVPGVVLIHGSGPQGRDEPVPGQLGLSFPEPVTVFADLANALRDAGYAVLTYDKRTCGPFNNCADNGYPPPASDLTVDDFVADADAAVAALRSRPEVQPDAIAIAGHSQGASFVPALLDEDPDLAAGVMLAAPFDPIDQIVAAQDPSLAGIGALRTEDVEETTMIAGASARFWRSWIELTDDAPRRAADIEQPLLVLGGVLDSNVPPAQTERWRRTLSGENAEVVLLGCITHALNCLATDDMRTIVPADVGTTVAPDVAAAIVDFLDRVVR